MTLSDYKLNYGASDEIECNKTVEGESGEYTYYFNLFPSGLEIRATSRNYTRYTSLYYIPSINAIVTKDGRFSSIEFDEINVHSYGFKIYTIHGATNSSQEWFSIHRNRWVRSPEGDGYYVSSSPVSPGSSITYQGYAGVRLIWKDATNYTYAFTSIKDIVFIECWLWIWEELKYNSLIDTNHYRLVKMRNSSNTDDIYKTISDASLIVGQKYSFLSYIGECYNWNSGPTGMASFNNGLSTIYEVNNYYFQNKIDDVGSNTAPYSITRGMLDFREPIQPTKVTRESTGRLGVQGTQISYVPYSNKDNNYYLLNSQPNILIAKTKDNNNEPINKSNPWVLFNNLMSDEVLNINGNSNDDVRWLDKMHLRVKDKIYLIPSNWKVELYTRYVSDVDAPTTNGGVAITGVTDSYSNHPAELLYNFVSESTGSILYEYYYSTISFASKPRKEGEWEYNPLTWHNNWTFVTKSQKLNRTNEWEDVSHNWTTKSSTVNNTNINLNALIETSDEGKGFRPPYSLTFDAIMTIISKIEVLVNSTSYPTINDNAPEITFIGSFSNNININKKQCDGNNQTFSRVNTSFEVTGLAVSNTYDRPLNDRAQGYITHKLIWQNNYSGLQVPQTFNFSLLKVGSEYRNQIRDYNGVSKTCYASTPNGSFTRGISFDIEYRPNPNYADTWYYLIAYPDE